MNPVLLVLGVVIGALLPIQASANAIIARQSGHPVYGALWNFVSGSVILLVVAAIIRFGGVWKLAGPSGTQSAPAGPIPWWALTGGILGAFFVATSAYIAPRIGAIMVTVTILLGQLVAAALADGFALANYPHREVTPARLAGIALVVAGVGLVLRGTK